MFGHRQPQILAALISLGACSFSFAGAADAQQVIGGIQIFPANSVFNTRIDGLPVDKNSSKYVNSIGATSKFHPDWGTNITYGIPFNMVTNASNPVTYFPTFLYASDSDAGPYPQITAGIKVEGNDYNDQQNDRHVLMVDTTNGVLYERWATDQSGDAGSGAIFPLNSNALRTDGFTSADAAGLPIFPLLVNYQEASGPGPIKHAFRFTGGSSNGHIWPGRHDTSHNSAFPPFGQRFRLKKNFNISSYSVINQKILTALKQYGMFYADGGSPWYVQGAPDPLWDDNDLNALKALKGSDFEAVNESSIMALPDSGMALLNKPVSPAPPKPTPWPKVK